MSDENMLPQTQAFVLETYRWRPVIVGGTRMGFFAHCPRFQMSNGFCKGIAHRATKDIIWVYSGLLIIV
jgi:hypothetical protein